jgi:copper chaperone CopZ
MKNLLMIMLVVFSTISLTAQNKNAKTKIEVDGVCGMCKERIEKAAIKTKGVKSAVWSIESHTLSLIFDERKTNVMTICESVAEAGHDTKMVKATEENYNKIHDCCRYRDKEVVDDH